MSHILTSIPKIRILFFPSVRVLGQPYSYGEDGSSSKLKSGTSLQEHAGCFTASCEDHGQILLILWTAMSSELKTVHS